MNTATIIRTTSSDMRKMAVCLEKHHSISNAEIARMIATQLECTCNTFSVLNKSASTKSQRINIRKHADDLTRIAVALDGFAPQLRESKIKVAYPLYNAALCNMVKYIHTNDLAPFVKTSGVWDTLKGVGRGVMNTLVGPWQHHIDKSKYMSNVKLVEKLEDGVIAAMEQIHEADDISATTMLQNLAKQLNDVRRRFARIASEASVNEDVYNFVLANAVVDTVDEFDSRMDPELAQSDPKQVANSILPSLVKTLRDVRRGISKWHTQTGIGSADPLLTPGAEKVPGLGAPPMTGYGRGEAGGAGGAGSKNKGPLDPRMAFQRKFWVQRDRTLKFLKDHGDTGKKILNFLGVPPDWHEYKGGEIDPITGLQRQARNRWPADLTTGADEAMPKFQQQIARLIQQLQRHPGKAEQILNSLGISIRAGSWYQEGVAAGGGAGSAGSAGGFDDPGLTGRPQRGAPKGSTFEGDSVWTDRASPDVERAFSGW